MKTLITTAMLLALTVPAMAQRTIKLYDKDKKEVIATATISGQRIYFHNMEGRHIATLARNPDNTVSAWDRNGKLMDPKSLPPLE